jgi:hypothetical protein
MREERREKKEERSEKKEERRKKREERREKREEKGALLPPLPSPSTSCSAR